MKYCSKHHSNPNDAIFCSECGEKLESLQTKKFKKYPKCKENNPLNATFCNECGANLKEHSSSNFSQSRSTSKSNENSRPNRIASVGNSSSTRWSIRKLFNYSSIINGKAYTWALTLVTINSIGSIFQSLGYVTVYGGYEYDWLFTLITGIVSTAMYRTMLIDKESLYWIWRIIVPFNILGFFGCGTNMAHIFKVELSIYYYIALAIFIIGYIVVFNKGK